MIKSKRRCCSLGFTRKRHAMLHSMYFTHLHLLNFPIITTTIITIVIVIPIIAAIVIITFHAMVSTTTTTTTHTKNNTTMPIIIPTFHFIFIVSAIVVSFTTNHNVHSANHLVPSFCWLGYLWYLHNNLQDAMNVCRLSHCTVILLQLLMLLFLSIIISVFRCFVLHHTKLPALVLHLPVFTFALVIITTLTHSRTLSIQLFVVMITLRAINHADVWVQPGRR